MGRAVAANVVDHIVAHHGDMERFKDRANLQSLCKACHDRHKQAQEHNADGIIRGASLTGRPIDLSHPWYQPHQVGAVKKSQPHQQKTGPCKPLAGCHNSEGGASA